MIRTIFFDFGNVVGFFDHSRALERLAAYTDMPAVEMAVVLYGGTLEDDYEHGRLGTDEFVRLAAASCRLTCDPDEFVAAYSDIFTPNPELWAAVPLLKPHYRLCLASNTNAAHSLQFRGSFAEVLAHFDALVLSQEVAARKPHRDFFERAHESAGCAPGEVLFFDDMPANVEGARAFGWNAELYEPGTLAERLAAHGVTLADPSADAPR